MAEILIVGRDDSQVWLLGATFNAKGWACKIEHLDRPAGKVLAEVAPAATVLIFRPGDEDLDRERVGEWLRAPGAVIVWLLVPESEIDLATDQLRGITRGREITWFSADSPVEEIAALIMTLAKTGRPTRAGARRARKVVDGMRLATAKRIWMNLRRLLPHLSMPKISGSLTPKELLRAIDDSIERFRLQRIAQAHAANLEQLAAEGGPNERVVRRMARAAGARADQARTDHVILVRAAARGETLAIDRLIAERPMQYLIELAARSLLRNKVGSHAAQRAAKDLIRKLVKIAARKVRDNETSSADLVGIVMWNTIWEFRRLRGARELQEVDESQAVYTETKLDDDGPEGPRLPATRVHRDGADYYPVSQAAEIVGLSPKTIHAWIAAGKVPARKDLEGRLLDVVGLHKLWHLKQLAARARRRQDPDGKLLTVSQVIGATRAKAPKEYERLNKRLVRAADALGIVGARGRGGGRFYTLDEARRLRRAIGVDQDDADE